MEFDDRTPIYTQIMDLVKRRIAVGELKVGQQLPSVRDLAQQVVVNPNTVQKAYLELEREGYVATQRGMGTFVSGDRGTVDLLRQGLAPRHRRRPTLSGMRSLGYGAGGDGGDGSGSSQEGDEMSMLVQISDLTKRYITTTALSDVTLEVPEGHIMGLLGPNGSGKTTLMKILAGLVSPTSGTVLVDGIAPGVATKAKVSFLPDVNHLDRWMSVGEAGNFYADFYVDFDRKRFDELLAIMRLSARQKIGSLSKGMVEKAQAVARLLTQGTAVRPGRTLRRAGPPCAQSGPGRSGRQLPRRLLDDPVDADGRRRRALLRRRRVSRQGLRGPGGRMPKTCGRERGASIEEIYREVYGHVEAR